jgi:GntR family transcriptional repressor for pyruvate dehydrogenase complex
LESRHGSGTVVRQVSRDALVEPLGWLIQSRGGTLDDLHVVRSILEVEIVQRATLQATDEEIADLERIVGDMGTNKEDVAAFVALDGDLHQRLSEITHNPLLALLLDSVRDLMQEVRLQVHRYPEVYDTVVPDHERIVAAMQSRDPAAAGRAMQQHLNHARAFQRELLAAQAVGATPANGRT